jgi:GT2 family glycosyltransferase
MLAKVYVLILSYRNAADTIECLESVLRLEYPDFEVVVCDNASPDGALDGLLEWAQGNRPAQPAAAAMRRFSEPPLPQPVPHRVLVAPAAGPVAPGPRLTFIRCAVNTGYAGGNNVGLRHILDRGDAGYVWVLNNDTVVERDALAAVVARAEAEPAVGLWGSLVRYYHEPDQVQARGGGRYRRWLGVSHYVTAVAAGGERLDYVLGAATLVSARFLREVGLMAEDYFLYFEELDWAERGKRAGFRLGVCAESVVFHKEGASTGIAKDPRAKSPFADYYVMRNRILFARRFHPWTRAGIYAGVFLSLLLRLRRGQRRNARVIGRLWWQMLWHGLPPGEHHPVRCD